MKKAAHFPGRLLPKNTGPLKALMVFYIISYFVNIIKGGDVMRGAQGIRPRPLEVKADQKNRLQIPVLVRRMIKAKPGDCFNLFVTEEGDLYFSKSTK